MGYLQVKLQNLLKRKRRGKKKIPNELETLTDFMRIKNGAYCGLYFSVPLLVI